MLSNTETYSKPLRQVKCTDELNNSGFIATVYASQVITLEVAITSWIAWNKVYNGTNLFKDKLSTKVAVEIFLPNYSQIILIHTASQLKKI
jgi:hypothetical protein